MKAPEQMKQQKSSQQSCVCFFFRFFFLFRQSFGVFFESSTIARGASFFSPTFACKKWPKKNGPTVNYILFFLGWGVCQTYSCCLEDWRQR